MRALQIWDENIYKKIVLKMYYKEISKDFSREHPDILYLPFFED